MENNDKTFILMVSVMVLFLTLIVGSFTYNEYMDDDKCPDKGYVYTSFFSLGEKCVFSNDEWEEDERSGNAKTKEVRS